MSLLMLRESSQNPRFSDDFSGTRSSLIRLNFLSIKNEIWRQSLRYQGLVRKRLQILLLTQSEYKRIN